MTSAGPPPPPGQPQRARSLPRPVWLPAQAVQGHRGARGLFPENTLEGFRAAMALGLRAFELDLGVTRDGVVVVHHDTALHPDIARRDGAWIDPTEPRPLLRDLTLAELRRYDVGRLHPGSPTALAHPRQQPADGARIPTLAEVLALDAGLWLTLELKVTPAHPAHTLPPEAMVELAMREVAAAGAEARVMLESFDWRCLRHLRRCHPAVPRGLLTAPETAADPLLWWGREAAASVPLAVAGEGGGTWAPHHATLTEAEVSEAHALGLLVLPWTVNEPAAMTRLAAWGVDGLITDRPDLALVAWRG